VNCRVFSSLRPVLPAPANRDLPWPRMTGFTMIRNSSSRPVCSRPAAPAAGFRPQYGNPGQSPQETLWAALRTAPEEGWEIGELMSLTGMSRSPLYRYLRDLVSDGRAYQVSRGRWRARPAEEVTVSDRPFVPPPRVSARNARDETKGQDEGTTAARTVRSRCKPRPARWAVQTGCCQHETSPRSSESPNEPSATSDGNGDSPPTA
jgi:hypothetical protein